MAVVTDIFEMGSLGSAVLRPHSHHHGKTTGKHFSEGSGFPMQISWSLTISRAGLDAVFGAINHSSEIPQPWPLLTANFSQRLKGTIPQELKLITDFKTQRF